MKYFLFYMFFICFSTCGFAQGIFRMPKVFPSHCLYVGQFMEASAAKDFERAETIARAAALLLPRDPNWSYNVACALAVQKKNDEALIQLEKAVRLGFRDIVKLENDPDLADLRFLPEFAKVISLAKSLQNEPKANASLHFTVPERVTAGKTVFVKESNTAWDWTPLTGGIFMTNLDFAPFGKPSTSYKGPCAAKINAWIAEGSAAGNQGDLYVNRDEDAVTMKTENFPGATSVVYSEEAVRNRVHVSVANGIFNSVAGPLPVVGNSSLLLPDPPYWRSLPRLIQTDNLVFSSAVRLAESNQLYVYSAQMDYNAAFLGDLNVANSSLYLNVAGEPANQVVMLDAIFTALAAMRPEVKRTMIRQGLLVQTMQRLIRQSIKNADYLSAAAHPVAFDVTRIDVEKLVELSHNLQIDDLPFRFRLTVRRESSAMKGRDFFDRSEGEILADSATCITRVMRSNEYTRKYYFEAKYAPVGTKFHWFPVHAQDGKLRIKPLTGDGSIVTVEVDYHGLYTNTVDGVAMPTRRVDLACVAEKDGVFSAPAFVNFRYLTNEVRVYDEKNRISSIDYCVPSKIYTDPLISAFKNWKDEYHYSEEGIMTGWTRLHSTGSKQEFNAMGQIILSRDASGAPLKVQNVVYRDKQNAENPARPFELIQEVTEKQD